MLAQNVQDVCGVTHADAKLITMIGVCPSTSQSTLADMLEVSPPAVSRQIERLVKKGYVTRVTNPDNRRAQDIGLTKEGEQVFKKTHQYLKNTLNEILDQVGGMSDQTQQELSRMTQQLKKDMTEDELQVQEAFENK